MSQLCAELLGLERVGMNDNFFDIGGHSLSAAQLLTRIRDLFGVDFALSNIFNCVNFRELSAVLATMIGDRPLPPAVQELVVPAPASNAAKSKAAAAAAAAGANSPAAADASATSSAATPSTSASSSAKPQAKPKGKADEKEAAAKAQAAKQAELDREQRENDRRLKAAAEVEAKIKSLPPVITG